MTKENTTIVDGAGAATIQSKLVLSKFVRRSKRQAQTMIVKNCKSVWLS